MFFIIPVIPAGWSSMIPEQRVTSRGSVYTSQNIMVCLMPRCLGNPFPSQMPVISDETPEATRSCRYVCRTRQPPVTPYLSSGIRTDAAECRPRHPALSCWPRHSGPQYPFYPQKIEGDVCFFACRTAFRYWFRSFRQRIGTGLPALIN